MNTLLEPPSSFFQSTPRISSLYAIQCRSLVLWLPNLELPSSGFLAITLSKTNIAPKASSPRIRSRKSFSLTPFALNIKSAPSGRDSCVPAIHTFPLTLQEIE